MNKYLSFELPNLIVGQEFSVVYPKYIKKIKKSFWKEIFNDFYVKKNFEKSGIKFCI